MRLTLLLLILLSSCNSHGEKPKNPSNKSAIFFEVLHKGEDVIWGFDFLDDGKIVFTERAGKMFVFDPQSKKAIQIKGVPAVYQAGQAGLLDVRAHPDFKTNHTLYFSYSLPIGKSESTTALGMGTLENNELKNVKKIFEGQAPNSNDIHYGSRIEFDGKGHLFFTMGERDERNHAQSLNFHQGKVMRVNFDGSVPQDNPFFGQKDHKPEIYSYGHRNPQGLTRDPSTGEIIEAEMGPQGGDEVNLIQPGKNYGWPVITYGKEYWGPKIGEPKKEGMEQPLVYWVPSISPSAITFYTGDKFPEWKNSLFLGTLSGEHIHRVVLKDHKVESQEELLGELGYRWRSVRTGPDGYLYLGTDEGRLGRLMRK